MSFTDALTRISEIQQQITTLTGTNSTASADTSGDASSTTSSSAATGSSSTSSQFAQALAEAQLTDGSSSADSTSGSDASELSDLLSATGTSSDSASDSSDLLSDIADLSGSEATGSALTGSATSGGAGLVSSGSAALSGTAASQLTSGQQQFASTLVADTGLNPGVVSAWLLSEESGGAAQSRQTSSNNDWLNIGYTDSGTDGAGDAIWSDPVSAANATAGWLKGQDSIPGYGTASAGIQSILGSVGQAPAAQISALQNSGWASSGYPSLASLYEQVAGGQA